VSRQVQAKRGGGGGGWVMWPEEVTVRSLVQGMPWSAGRQVLAWMVCCAVGHDKHTGQHLPEDDPLLGGTGGQLRSWPQFALLVIYTCCCYRAVALIVLTAREDTPALPATAAAAAAAAAWRTLSEPTSRPRYTCTESALMISPSSS
jgi:hypothetical protein